MPPAGRSPQHRPTESSVACMEARARFGQCNLRLTKSFFATVTIQSYLTTHCCVLGRGICFEFGAKLYLAWGASVTAFVAFIGFLAHHFERPLEIRLRDNRDEMYARLNDTRNRPEVVFHIPRENIDNRAAAILDTVVSVQIPWPSEVVHLGEKRRPNFYGEIHWGAPPGRELYADLMRDDAWDISTASNEFGLQHYQAKARNIGNFESVYFFPRTSDPYGAITCTRAGHGACEMQIHRSGFYTARFLIPRGNIKDWKRLSDIAEQFLDSIE